MTSLHFVVHPLPGTEEQLNERLKAISDKLNKFGSAGPSALNNLRVAVRQIVVGPTHFALLLEDGRICRVSFSIITDRLDLSNGDPPKKSLVGARQMTRARSRLVRSTAMRGSGSRSGPSGSIMTTRPVVPAPFVPEELVAHAQVVLQGKSRNLIIRELQRTNLDVNLAVNNLLSRDEEEGDDTEDAQDSYVPEDLISLLDGGFHDQHSVIIDADTMFSEDMFGYSAIRRGGSSSRRQASGLERDREGEDGSRRHGERDSFSRWRDRQYFGPRKWLENALSTNWDNNPDSKKKEMAQQSPLWTSDELEYWPDNNVRFTMMAALHSELIAVSSTGQLYQWRWADPEPYRHPDNPHIHHPKTVQLGLLYDKITMVSGAIIRASAVTDNNKVCTWVDESLTPLAGKLEIPLTSFPELGPERITSLHTCALYTLVRLETGAMYWWGVLPFNQRRKLWEKFRAKSRKHRPSSSTQELAVGNQVCMKNAPVCQPGAVGFTIACGVPRVGVLQNAAWNLTDVCRFKLMPTQVEPSKSSLSQIGIATTLSAGLPSKTASHKETADRLDMPPPPSPASSTCSDSGSTSHKRAKRPANKANEQEERKDEEDWLIRNVIFLEDVKTVPVGRVLKVDGAYAAVRFPTMKDGKEVKEAEDSASVLQDCRLMRVEDLQVLKSNTTSRAPDCFQRTPKRVNVPEAGNIMALTVDQRGIHCIVKNSAKLCYVVYNLSNGRVDQESVFPADCSTSFLGLQPSNIQLTRTGESNEGVVIVRDGNSTIFPMVKDCLDSVRDPQWLDLPPVRCLGAGTHALSSLPNKNLKNQVAVIILAVEAQLLMSKILRCDLDGIKSVLSQMEVEAKSGIVGFGSTIASVLAERCDGNRNIFHACVTMCIPTGNKEEPEFPSTSSAPAPSLSGLESINVITNALGSRSSNLREIMRRASAVAARSSVSQHSRGPPDSVDAEAPSPSAEEPIPTLSWPPDPLNHSGDEDSFMDLAPPAKANTSSGAGCSKFVLDPTERKNNSLAALKLLCMSPALEPYLLELLSAKDAQGQTPFMMGVALRAYPAAALILDAIQIVTAKQPESEAKTAMNSMIYPPGSNPDFNPLHVLCCNDTCSFTWTGAEHINQDIFECRTCGLIGSLCCCTECARVCHRGHDCKLKKTSPTAYCDCWEKCKCKALIMGHQGARLQLLTTLINITELVAYPNTRGENLLLFLVQTVGRQSVEQRQFRTPRPRTGTNSRKTPSSDVEIDMPEHDLEPPRFSRRALDKFLGDWNAVRSMLMSGVKATTTPSGSVAYLQSQSGTTLLDKFTHCLLVKCSTDLLDALLGTLIRELQIETDHARQADAKIVARRFIRSVARIFVIFSIEMTPSSTKKRGVNSHSQHILKCRRAFQALMKLAIEELCEIADSLIAPVRLGVVRPTAPFTLTSNSMDVLSGSEELFSVEPMSLNGGGTSNTTTSASIHIPPTTPAQPPSVSMEMDDVDNTEGMAVDDDTSEQEDVTDRLPDRGEQLEGENHDMTGNQLEDGDQRDDQSDTTELDLLAESESDSDDNQDNPSTQSRSEQTAATVGSDTDEDSGESSQQEEEESEAGETDEQEAGEELPLGDEQLERRNPMWSGSRTNLAPHSMQWAIRSREPRPARTGAGVRVAGTSSLVFIDPSSLRRSTSAAVAAQAQANCEPVTMATTASCLARAFAIVVRQIADLVTMLHDYQALPTIGTKSLDVSSQEVLNIQLYLEYHLRPTWDWLLVVMDSTEAQLRFGASLTQSTDPAHKGTVAGHPLHQVVGTSSTSTTNTTTASYSVSALGAASTSNASSSRGQSSSGLRTSTHGTSGATGPRIVAFSGSSNEPPRAARDRDAEVLSGAGGSSARRELLSYCLSLMRAHNSEHLDSLPVLDVSALKHIAYVLDALIYYMRSGYTQDPDVSSKTYQNLDTWATDQDENENEENEDELNRSMLASDSSDENDTIGLRGRKHPFLQRSDSTLCLGCPPPDPFELPLAEALPLAEQPHLLQPNARREDLFGMPKQPITIPASGTNTPGTYNPLENLPTRLGLSMRTADSKTASGGPVMNATPSAHLAPCGFGSQSPEKPRSQGGYHEQKTPAFLDMYEHLMREMEDTTPTGPEEPQDLSVHQDAAKMDIEYSDSYSDSDYETSRGSAGKPSKDEERRDSKTLGLPSESVGEHSSSFSGSKSKKPGSPIVAAQSLLNLSLTPPLPPHTPPHPPPSPPGPSPGLPSRAPIIVTRKNVANAISLAIEITLPPGQKPTAKEDPSLNDLNLAGLSTVAAGSSAVASATTPTGGKSVIVRAGASTQNSLSTEAPDVLVVPTAPRTVEETGDSSVEIAHTSTHVTVETTPAAPVQRAQPTIGQSVSHDLLLGRWRLSLDLFGRVFMEDVGLEPGSVVAELGGFPVKEAKFRREMERLRNAQQRDLNFSKMERDRTSLIIATMKELNNHYSSSHRRTNTAPLAVNRVKVTFKDEPGEGSGVARSFYTAIAEALLANEKLPNLEGIQPMERLRPSDIPRPSARSASSSIRLMNDPRPRRALSLDARPFKPPTLGSEAQQLNRNDHLTSHQKQFGEKLYPKVHALRPSYATKITGMLLELTSGQILMLMANDDTLKQKVDQAYEMILNFGVDSSVVTHSDLEEKKPECELTEVPEDNSPLFYCPGKRGFHCPRQGRGTYYRLNAFRNVGRLLGLCLLQNELCPIFLCRHVLKYILGRTIRFHDLAFFDPVIHESLRQLVLDAETKDGAHILATIDFNFSIDLAPEEGGGSVELVPGGRDIPVTIHNVYDYVRKYAQYRMIKSQEKALAGIRLGVFEVLPPGALDGLTAEDLRLLLNGVGDINVQVLISYTSFNDESGEPSERLVKFKRWLWSIVDKMTHIERQDLVYFWTGSPALPASEDGFQPMPSVTIRPADDVHLPTANTCISRLYIPLYSCRQVLRHKLLIAIKTKNFGFV